MVDSFYARRAFRMELKSQYGPHTYIDFLFIGYNLIIFIYNYLLVMEYQN